MQNFIDSIYHYLLSEKTRKKSEKTILIIALISFVLHLLLIYMVDLGLISLRSDSELLRNPISAIYSPFSFILIYEVYLLVYYLPKSFTNYISKQYEIITLIIIRRLFKDLSTLELSSNWFQIKDDLQFTYDIVASIILFFLLYLFYRQTRIRYQTTAKNTELPDVIHRFIHHKKIIAIFLVPTLLVLAVYTFADWTTGIIQSPSAMVDSLKGINNVFFDEFFTILIIVDVIILLLSFFHTDQFHKVIRNSGFIISTILIRLSFSVEGLLNTILIVSAITFGLIIVIIHNQFEKNLVREDTD